MPDAPRDLVLSSGFLAFARHAGVVQALRDEGLTPAAVVGTSSGAVVAALTCAGVSPETILDEVAAMRPLRAMRLNPMIWNGLFTAPGLRAMLERHLPARLQDLPVPLGVGVITRDRRHRLVTQGPLVDAVLASCAMPWVFAAVDVAGERLADGGAIDRVGLDAWRQWRPGQQAWVHQVRRTAGVDVASDRAGTLWIETPRSGASFWNLGDVHGQAAEARTLALAALSQVAR